MSSCSFCGDEYGVKLYSCMRMDCDICEGCFDNAIEQYCEEDGELCEYVDECKIYNSVNNDDSAEKQFKIEIYVTVENSEEAREIANDLHEILNDDNITNSVNLVEED